MRSPPAGELVDIVDDHDVVVGTATRAEMRAGRLRHRCVAVLVRHPDGRVLAHRRSPDKDVWPGRWDLAVGGVVGRGESYETAAARELAEEVGIHGVTPRYVRHVVYDDDDVSEQARLYEVTWDGPLHFADGEVVEARWLTASELRALIAQEPFCPDTLALAASVWDVQGSAGGARGWRGPPREDPP
jgi:isopentenyldiphosphate isomerase